MRDKLLGEDLPLAQCRLDALAPRLYEGVEVGNRVVSAIMLSPSDVAGQDVVVDSAQRVLHGTRARHYSLISPLSTLGSAPTSSSTPGRKTPRRRSRAEEKQVSGFVPRYLLPPSSCYADEW